jgi:hypothetical protein
MASLVRPSFPTLEIQHYLRSVDWVADTVELLASDQAVRADYAATRLPAS